MHVHLKPLTATLVALALFGIAGLTGTAARAQTTISTIPGNILWSTGGSMPIVIGQTFTTPADNVLTSFALQLDNTQALTLSVFAYNESTNTAVGGPLFTSAPTSPTLVAGRNGYSFSTGELSLTTGQVYAALLSGTTSYSGPRTAGPPDPYAGGKFIIGDNLPGPFTPWESIFGGTRDLTFTATFVIPEPGTLTLLGTGALGLLGYGWRRRRRAA